MRGGLKWLNMGYLLHQRPLPTARADWLPLIRNRTLVQRKLIEELSFCPDVQKAVALVHDT